MSQVATEILLLTIYEDRRINLSITAGSSPIKTYELLTPIVSRRGHFDNVHYYNFDEIPYKHAQRAGITLSDLRELYYSPAKIDEENTHILNCENYQGQDQRIKADGGLDLILLEIGTDGHYCGNLPGTTKFGDKTTLVHMYDYLKSRVAPHFSDKKRST